jgi:hypothetical protein
MFNKQRDITGCWGFREGTIVVGFVLLGKDSGAALRLSVVTGILGIGASIHGSLVWVVHLVSSPNFARQTESVRANARQKID